MFGSRELEEITGRSPVGLRRVADALPIAPAVKGKAREFTTGDAVLVLCAIALQDRGFAPAAARSMIGEVAAEISRLVVDDTAGAWLVAWSEPAAETGVGFQVAHDKSGALDLILARNDDAWTIVDVRSLVRAAMVRILEAKERHNG